MTKIEQISNEIATAIKQSHMSQTEIANAVGLSHAAISQFVHNKSLPALDTLSKLCEILDLDANEILCVKK